MFRSTLIGAVVALAVGAGAAHAGEWLYVGHSSRIVVGYDNGSVRVSGNRRTFWAVYVYETTDITADTAVDYFLARTVIDCDLETQHYLSAT